MKRWITLLIISWLLCPLISFAHKPSDSFLSLDLSADRLTGQWAIALRDLDYAIGVDGDGDGAITWGELKQRYSAITDYALARLSVDSAGATCTFKTEPALVDSYSDGAYVVVGLLSDCTTAQPINLDYRLFFDLDPSHRGLLKTIHTDGVQTAILSPEQSHLSLVSAAHSLWSQFSDYWQEGVWHIWIGFDHILFLLALLLPTVLWRENGRWRSASCLRSVVVDVAAIVTAFTIAHSITLSLAVLGWISLPARWVESAIAATVILAALNNLYPLLPGKRWAIAFGLGLIHGFSFASVLVDLGLPSSALGVALLGFNLGVETGQLVIVAGFLPLAYLLRGSWLYRRAALPLGSFAVAVMATLWFAERSFNINLIAL